MEIRPAISGKVFLKRENSALGHSFVRPAPYFRQVLSVLRQEFCKAGNGCDAFCCCCQATTNVVKCALVLTAVFFDLIELCYNATLPRAKVISVDTGLKLLTKLGDFVWIDPVASALRLEGFCNPHWHSRGEEFHPDFFCLLGEIRGLNFVRKDVIHPLLTRSFREFHGYSFI